MKNKLLLGAALSGLCFSHTLWASDSLPDQISSLEGAPLPSQHIVVNERAQKIQEARDILSNNGQMFKTAYELCFKAAHSLLDNTNKTSLSDELIEDAKRWMGSATDFGKDYNWPEGMHDDKKVVAMIFFDAVLFWLQHYSFTMLSFQFLENCDNDIFLKSAELELFFYVKSYLSSSRRTNRIQTEDEIRRFGEYPQLDCQKLFVLPAFCCAKKIQSVTRGTGIDLIDPKESYLYRILRNSESNINAFSIRIDQIKFDFLAFYLIKNNQFSENQATEIKKLQTFKTEKARRKYIDKKIHSISEDLKVVVNSIEETVNSDGIKQAMETLKKNAEEKIKILEETKEPSDPKTSQKKKRKANKKGKGKKGKKSSVKHQKIDNALPAINHQKSTKDGEDNKNKDALDHDKDHLPQGDFSNKDVIEDETIAPSTNVFPVPIQHQDDQTDETKNEEPLPDHKHEEPLPDDEDYEWDPEAQRAEFKRFDQLKNAKNERTDEVTHTSPYAPIPYFTQQVTEKFLDIFGNKEGDARKKNALNGYERQGWGSIDELKSVLEHAGWIFNGNYESSTISFRMPNSSKEFKAAFLKFHNDHNVGQQGMREITRHFIMKGLEFAGYTEEFLTHYHCHNFSRI